MAAVTMDQRTGAVPIIAAHIGATENNSKLLQDSTPLMARRRWRQVNDWLSRLTRDRTLCTAHSSSACDAIGRLFGAYAGWEASLGEWAM